MTAASAGIQWLGKAFGSVIGVAAAGPVGLLLGFVLGHRLDQGLAFGRAGTIRPVPKDVAEHFLRTTFELMGRVAKADGRVSEEEIRVARGIMHTLELNPEQVSAAIAHFTVGKQADYPLAERLSELGRKLEGRRDLARAFVEIQMQAAIAAGPVDLVKRRLLWRIASALGIGRVELAQIEALLRADERRRTSAAAGSAGIAPDLDAAYRVLGVGAAASDGEVKRAYRRLMNRHHPDKLAARGLSEAEVARAEQKTHEIRAAYDRIKAHRSMK